MKIKTLAITVTAVAMSAATSFAGTIVAKFNSVTPSLGVNYVSPAGNAGTTAGVFNWNRTGGTQTGTPAIGSNFASFCIELTQNISPGGTYTMDVIPLAHAPVPGVPPIGGMGAAKAKDLKRLWASYFHLAALSNVNAAAFQVSVWEIVYETAAQYDVNTANAGTRGAFYITNQSAVRNLANSWLGNLGTAEANLAAMSHPSFQDQLVLIPAPPAVLAGLGLLGVGVANKLRNRRSERTV
jgi:hypothetical protein